MPIFDSLNMTTSQGVAPGVVDYYERTLIENAKPDMVHGRDGQKRSLPENNGKHVQFRRMIPYEASTQPLKEGITPKGQEIRQTAFTAMVKPYGRHVELTDELKLYQLDDMHEEVAQLLSDQAILSLDTICREALCAGMNVQYANGKASRAAVTAGDILTADEVKKAVRTLKRNNCKPFADGFYHAIVHVDSAYDLKADKLWIDVATYQDKAKIEKGELGCIHGVKFYESTNAKKYEAAEYLYDEVASLTLTSADVATKTASFSQTITPDGARELTGKLVEVTSGETVTLMCIDRVDYNNKKISFRWMPDAAASWSNATMSPEGTSATADLYATLIYGQNAYGDIELGGNGKNIKVIIHAPGHGDDPLEQRGTIAWKVKGFCCTILQDSFIVRIEHGATA